MLIALCKVAQLLPGVSIAAPRGAISPCDAMPRVFFQTLRTLCVACNPETACSTADVSGDRGASPIPLAFATCGRWCLELMQRRAPCGWVRLVFLSLCNRLLGSLVIGLLALPGLRRCCCLLVVVLLLVSLSDGSDMFQMKDRSKTETANHERE